MKSIKQVINDSKEPTIQELYDELKSIKYECFVCGQPITSDDMKIREDYPDAHRKCYDQWLNEREETESYKESERERHYGSGSNF